MFNPTADAAIRYIDAVGGLSDLGIRFPYNDDTATSLTVSAGATLTDPINNYDELIIDTPLKITVSPCIINARRVKLAACPLLSATASAGQAASVTAIGGSVAWTAPTNIFLSDNLYATAALSNNVSHYLKATNFGFAIPTSAIIVGIEALIECSMQGSGGNVRSVKLVKGDVISGVNKANNEALTTTESVKTFGSNSDLWGADLTPADVNAATFGVAYAAVTTGTDTTRVDRIQITVYYYNGGMIYADGAGAAGGVGATGARPSGSAVNATAANPGAQGDLGNSDLTKAPQYHDGLATGGSGAGGTSSGAGGTASGGGAGGRADATHTGPAGGAVGAAGVV
ncbi:MAG: hypothetical protein ACSLFM_10535, partial [Tepidiformaceae bacterium]